MKTLNRWIRRLLIGLGVLAGLLVLTWGALYFYTEHEMQGTELPVVATLPKGDAAAGKRLAKIQGCSGCHGAQLQGDVLAEIPNVVRLIAPNLTRARDRYDQAAFLRLMRAGTKADGRLALVMPNKAHQRLTDQQLADLEAFMRSVPAVDDQLPPSKIYPLARIGIVTGEYNLDEMRADTPESAVVLADRTQTNRVRHFVQTTCSECHGLDMQGDAKEEVPPLFIARAYSDEQFLRLMHEGKTLAGTDTASGFMSEVARSRFSGLTAQEVAAMKAFLGQPPLQ
jgi:mono/diheme cytochrome c family protein